MNVIISLGVILLLGAFYSWTSRINGLFFFGRTDENAVRLSDKGQAVSRRYRNAMIAVTVAAFLLGLAGSRLGHRFTGIAVLAQIVVATFLFARANREAGALLLHSEPAEPRRIVEVPLFQPLAYWIPGVLLTLLPVMLIAALTFAGVLVAPGIGLPAKWDAWNLTMEHSQLSMLLGMGWGMVMAATGVLLVLRTSARLQTRMAQYSVRACVAMMWIDVAVIAGVVLCNRYGIGMPHMAMKVVLGLALAAALGLNVWNQKRSKRFVPPPVELGADERWRWGQFYVDRNDPALLVQSRCGAGYSLNFGRALAWPIAVALVVYAVGVLFLLPLHHA